VLVPSLTLVAANAGEVPRVRGIACAALVNVMDPLNADKAVLGPGQALAGPLAALSAANRSKTLLELGVAHGDDLEIGFNSRFLLEMLSNLDADEIKLSMSEPSRAGLLTRAVQDNAHEDILMLVMPVMLNR
jgi:hypothetical protein